jgi:Alpha/beta hydrolase domain
LPSKIGKPYANLVAAVDADGNELAGIRLPDISVPLVTYTGWSVRHPDIGGPGQTLSLLGSTMPFPATQAERQALGDQRPSIAERFLHAQGQGCLIMLRQLPHGSANSAPLRGAHSSTT